MGLAIRLRFGGARIKDRYRAAYWAGQIIVPGATVLDIQGVGFDHPEQTVWRAGNGIVSFRTATHGDSDCIELMLSTLVSARIEVRADIHGYVKIGDPRTPPPHVHAPSVYLTATGDELIAASRIERNLPGVELHIALERVSDAPLPRDVCGEIILSELGLERGREHSLFITARQRDQARIWTSPLFLTPAI